jgi:hypothetical protein
VAPLSRGSGHAIAQGVGPVATPSTATGTWETGRQTLGPWIFKLEANGNTLAGRVWQSGGVVGPVEIFDGRIDGNTLSFKYRFFATPAPRGQQPTNVTVTLTGILRKDEIAFTSQVAPPPGPRGPFGGDTREEGLFGQRIARSFTVKRGDAAVSGEITIESGIPIPAFQLGFIDAKGKRFDPIRREGPSFGIQAPNLRNFFFRLPPGAYSPAVSGLPKGYSLKSIRAGSSDLTGEKLTVIAGAAIPELTVELGITSGPPWTKVSGRVVNVETRMATWTSMGGQRGSSVSPPTSIELLNPLSEPWTAPIGPSGAFEFSTILPGTYPVRFLPDSQPPSNPTLQLIVPASGRVNVEIRAPDIRYGCPGC